MYRQFLRHSASRIRSVHISPRAGELRLMKMDTPQFKELFTPELKQLVGYFDKFNYELRIAGGAVRDLLMGKQPQDIDFATVATPDQMKSMFDLEKIRMINNKGEKHGTITARINDKENFEVTTLRIDVLTDGRHAEVEFTMDWQLDANRRDLTINAMFLGFDGTLYDYFNGRQDLDDRKVCFVGQAVERIQEDYLRILRYFRFYGRIARGPDLHDPNTLEAIRENAGGLAGISGERLWMEVRKILTGTYAGPIVTMMLQLGIGPHIGLPAKTNTEDFQRICDATEELSPMPMTRLSALLENVDQVYDLHKRLKLSTEELKLGLFIVQHRKDELTSSPMRYCRDLLIDTVGREPKVKNRIEEVLKYKGEKDLLEEFKSWSPPRFPITGHDLFAHNVPKGPAFSKTINELRQAWKKSNCEMTKDELLERIDSIVKAHTTG